MMDALAKQVLRNVPPEKQRTVYGMLCSAVGIGLNVILFVLKFFAGTMTGSIAITADAFNNISDAGSSAVTLAGFHWGSQKPDSDHPFGHGRAEYLSSLVVAFLVLTMGIELGQQSFLKILVPNPLYHSSLAIGILAVSIVVKLYMYRYNTVLGKRFNAPAMLATATDSLLDSITTTVVLIATLVGQYTQVTIDGWCGLAVAVFILYSGFQIGKDTIDPLLGKAPSPALVTNIHNLVLRHPEVLGVHDLMIHDYGPGRRIISLHAEVPAEGDFLSLHEIIDQAEQDLHQQLQCVAIIHMDPIVTADGITQPTAQRVSTLMTTIDHRIHIHDFRMVAGNGATTKLIFDLVVPYDCAFTDGEVNQLAQEKITTLNPDYRAVILVERG